MAIVGTKITVPLHKGIELALTDCELDYKGAEHNVTYMVGGPGAGKTKGIISACRERNYGVLVYTPGLERAEKFGGIPDMEWRDMEVQYRNVNDAFKSQKESKRNKPQDATLNKHKELHTIWSVPQMIVETRNMASEKLEDGVTPKYERIVVLFDDWHICPANIQQIGFEMFTHRSLNGHKIPDNVTIILAGNDKSTAGAKVQLTAIKNRCSMLHVTADVEHWIDNYAHPNKLLHAGISFFKNPEYQAIFHEEESTSDQFASPRSWTSLFNRIEYLESCKMSSEDKERAINAYAQGEVGPKASGQFLKYYRIYSQIDVDEIFTTGKYTIPEKDPMKLYAFGSAISFKFYNLYCSLYKNLKGKDNAAKTKAETELKRIAGIFNEVLTKLMTGTSKEIAILTFKTVLHKSADDENGFPDGRTMFMDMSMKNLFNRELVTSITRSFNNAQNI